MKKALALVGVLVFFLFLTACPNDNDETGSTNNTGNDNNGMDDHKDPPILVVKISNQSGVDLWSVRWNNDNFSSFMSPPPMPIPENLYPTERLESGSSATAAFGQAASGYIFFKFIRGTTVYSVRTQAIMSLEDEHIEFTINDNTVVVDTTNTLPPGPLSSFGTGS
jgi:hypothetical protein